MKQNLISDDDNIDDNKQFKVTSILQPKLKYFLIFTTSHSESVGKFLITI